MFERFVKSYADRRYRHTAMVAHKGTVIAFAMDEARRIHYAVLALAAQEVPTEKPTPSSPFDVDAWPALPSELPFTNEIADIGFGIADQHRLRVWRVGAAQAEPLDTPLPARDAKLTPFQTDYFRSTTARLTADAPFQVLSDKRFIYVFRQAVTQGEEGRLFTGELRANAASPGTPVVDGHLLVDRFQLIGTVLVPKLEARYQRSRSKTRPQSSKDSLGPRDLDGNPFLEPTQILRFMGPIEQGRFAVTILPTQVAEVERWQIFTHNRSANQIDAFNIERDADGLFNTRGSPTYTCIDHPKTCLTQPGACAEPKIGAPTESCGKDLIPRRALLGQAESALAFATADSRVELESALAIQTPFTLEAWVKPQAADENTDLALFTGRAGSGAAQAWITLAARPGNDRLDLTIQGIGSGDSAETTLPACLQADQWNHLAVVCTAQACRIHVDGTLVRRIDLNGRASPSWQLSVIGHATQPFRGTIDDVRVWRRARSARELASGKNERLTGLEPGLAAYWRFDEASGDRVFDQSRGGHHGRITGAQWVASDAPVGEHPGIERTSFFFADQTIIAAPSALLYYQQAPVKGGYSGEPKPVKQGARLMFAVPVEAQGRAHIAALDFGVSGSGRITQVPDRIELPVVDKPPGRQKKAAELPMPHRHTDAFGLSLSAGLLTFARTRDAPYLVDSANGRLALHFRAAPETTDRDAQTQHRVAYFSTQTIPPEYRLRDTSGRTGVSLVTRATHAGSDQIRITIAPGSTAGLCSVTMEGNGIKEAWQDVPREAARLADVVNGKALGRDRGYDYRRLATTSKVGAQLYDGSLLVVAGSVNSASSIVDQTVESAPALVSRWMVEHPGHALRFSASGDQGSLATLAPGASNPAFSGDFSVEAWVRPFVTHGATRVLTHRSTDGTTHVALGLRPLPLDSALRFQAQADFVQLAQPVELKAPRLTTFTVECWLRIESEAGARCVIGNTSTPQSAPLTIWIDEDGRLHFGFGDLTRNFRSIAEPLGHPWRHLALVYDGNESSGVLSFFLDAVPVATLRARDGISEQARIIGTVGLLAAGGATLPRQFAMDELRVWRRARSAEEIDKTKDLHLVGDEPDLEACIRFEGGAARDHANPSRMALVLGARQASSAFVNHAVYASANGLAVQTRATFAWQDWMHLAATFQQSWALEFAAPASGGASAYLDGGDAATLDIPGDLTIEMTIRIDRFDGGNGLLSRGRLDGTQDDQNVPYALYVAPDGKLRFAFQDSKHRTQFTGSRTALFSDITDVLGLSLIVPDRNEPIGPTLSNGELQSGSSAWIESSRSLPLGKACRIAVRRKRINRQYEYGAKPEEKRVKTVAFDAIAFFIDGSFAGACCYAGDQGSVEPSGQPTEVGSSNGSLEIGRGFAAAGSVSTAQGTVPAPHIGGLKGAVSEIRIWGQARPDAAIGAPLRGNEKGLVAWWRFDEGHGPRVADAKGNHHAKIHGSLAWRRDPDPKASRLLIHHNGVQMATVPVEPGFDTIGIIDDKPQFTIGGQVGGRVDGREGFSNAYDGALDEIRLWRTVRTEEQIADNMFARLAGNEEGLEAYFWAGQADAANRPPARLEDRSPEGHHLLLSNVLAHVTDAPLGHDAPQIRDALAIEPASRWIDHSWQIGSRPAVQEYADTQYDDSGALIGVLKRCHAVIRGGRWQLFTGFKVGDLITEWLGQVQFAPELKGYIEGAPPVPSENLTQKAVPGIGDLDDYNQASTIALVEAEEVARTYSASRDGGFDMAIETQAKAGVDIESEAGTPFFSMTLAKAEMYMGLKTQWEFSQGWLQEASTSSGLATGRTTSLELRGRFVSDETRRRFVPDNVGLALVQSETADVYALRLRQNHALVGFRMLPNPDIPKDWNLLHFKINPRYVKQGTLDGKLGLGTDEDYPNALQYSGDTSYFKPIEAYALKNHIRREEAAAAAYYDGWDAEGRGKRAVTYGGDKDLMTGELLEKLPALHRSPDPAKTPRLHKRNLVNTYVWTADGGFFAEAEETMDAQQETTGGNYAFKGMAGLGFELSATVPSGGAFGVEVQGLFGGHLNLTATKSRESKSSFHLEVALDTVERDLYRRVVEGDTVTVMGDREAGKVDAYRFMTFYLEPRTDNFEAFYNRVVDPEWLQSDDPSAAALRQAQQDNKKPACWRVLHRVTYVSRVLPPEGLPQASPLEALLPALDIDSNYELIKQLDPYVRDSLGSHGEFSAAVRSAVSEHLPRLLEHVDAIVNFMAHYYGLSSGAQTGSEAQGQRPPNAPPVILAGDDQTMLIPEGQPAWLKIEGRASDDRIEDSAQLDVKWSLRSGPAPVLFRDEVPSGWSTPARPVASTLTAQARFLQRGSYVLRLMADDGALTASDDVTVIANEAPRLRLTALDPVPQRNGAVWTLRLLGEIDSGLGLPPTQPEAVAAAINARLVIAAGGDHLTIGQPSWAFSESPDGHGLSLQTTASFRRPGTYRIQLQAQDAAAAESIVTIRPRSTEGLHALHTFDVLEQGIVRDAGNAAHPLDLLLEPPTAAAELRDGLSLSGAMLVSSAPASVWSEAVARSNAFTIEAWIRPQQTAAGGLRRILTVSDGPGARNLVLGQTQDRLHVGVRTTGAAGQAAGQVDANASVRAFSGGRLEVGQTAQVVCTRAPDGMTRLYLDGALVAERWIDGDCSAWDRSFRLALGNEWGTPDGVDRSWHGTLQLAALYDRALSAEEIAAHLSLGPSPALPVSVWAGGDQVIDWAAAWPATVTLAARVRPLKPIDVTWSLLQGTDVLRGVEAAALRSLNPTLVFTGPARARLRLTVSDPPFVLTDEAEVEVNAPPRLEVPAVQQVVIGDAPVELELAARLIESGRITPAGTDPMRYAWRVVGEADETDGVAKGILLEGADQLKPRLRITRPGDYRLQLVASNGRALLDQSHACRILASRRSVVTLGPERLLNLPERGIQLQARIEQDGRADPSLPFICVWAPVAGPGSVVLTPDAKGMTAQLLFTSAGEYRVAVTLIDPLHAELVSQAELAITVNEPPIVDAGPDQTLVIAARGDMAEAQLDATVTDDGLPRSPGALMLQWSGEGPFTVPFTDARADYTKALFWENGRYRLSLAASDGAVSVRDDLAIDVHAPPVFEIVAPRSALRGRPASFGVSIGNDGLAVSGSGALRYAWQVLPAQGFKPGPLDRAQLPITFHEAGRFELRLTVSNGHASATRSVQVDVGDLVTEGLLALFDFLEHQGQRVVDSAGSALPMDLTITGSGTPRWLPGGGLTIEPNLDVVSVTSAPGTGPERVITALKLANALTVEAWLRPGAVNTGRATVFALGSASLRRTPNIALQQVARSGGAFYRIQLMYASWQAMEKSIEIDSPTGSANELLTHVAFTRDADGQATLYINAEPVDQRAAGDSLSPWQQTAVFTLGSDTARSGSRWSGELCRLALYGRALTPAEIRQNHAARPKAEAPE
ncbi:MAG: hypothetical protein JNJ71_12665 [Rubrivivax sp.]|nr:hypothetical protein [Rubrivivax sp.]